MAEIPTALLVGSMGVGAVLAIGVPMTTGYTAANWQWWLIVVPSLFVANMAAQFFF